MKVLIFSLEEQSFKKEFDVGDLNYNTKKFHFWMRLVMGNDRFQRVTSTFDFTPQIVGFFDRMCFVVCSKNEACEVLVKWLTYAEEQVEEGYRTMRGNLIKLFNRTHNSWSFFIQKKIPQKQRRSILHLTMASVVCGYISPK